MIDENVDKIRKKTIFSLVMGIVVLLILLIGSTYAYFSMRAINNFGSKNLSARAGNLGSVVLSGNHASLTMSLSKLDMEKSSNNIIYYASSSGKTTTPTEVTIGSAIANSGQDTVSNDIYNTYHCEYTIHATHTASDNSEQDLYDWFASEGYNNERSYNQLMLTINGVDYDFNDGWPEYIKGSFELGTINPKNLTVGFKFVNSKDIDQSLLSGRTIDIDVEVEKFECIPAFNDLQETYWAFEVGDLETTDLFANRVNDYHNLDSVYVLYYESPYYIIGPYTTQVDCETALANYSKIENATCSYNSINKKYFAINYKTRLKTFSTQAACESKLGDYDSSANASCVEVNNDIFIKDYSTYETGEKWGLFYEYPDYIYRDENTFPKELAQDILKLKREAGDKNITFVEREIYASYYIRNYPDESQCKNRVDLGDGFCLYNETTGTWYGGSGSREGRNYFDLDNCEDNNESGYYCMPSTCSVLSFSSRYSDYNSYDTKELCYEAFNNSEFAYDCIYTEDNKWKIAYASYYYSDSYSGYKPQYSSEAYCLQYSGSQPTIRVNSVNYSAESLLSETFSSGVDCEKYLLKTGDYYYYLDLGFRGFNKRLYVNNSCRLLTDRGYYSPYSYDIKPAEVCVNIKDGNTDNVVCIKPNSWSDVNNYKTLLESKGLTCSYIDSSLHCENVNYLVDMHTNGDLYISDNTVTCKYEHSIYACYLN